MSTITGRPLHPSTAGNKFFSNSGQTSPKVSKMASEMAQCMKMTATKPGDLGSISGSHMVERVK